ncbi:MAG TPA: ferritin family protein [Mobilitalea sp.]|nr:ferritin family protein [Mobilitalea sp.]
MNGLDNAINMELEGKRYYEEQAANNKENELYTVFMLLADSESKHAELLLKRKKLEELSLEEKSVVFEIKSVFTGLVDFNTSMLKSPSQLDAYRLAVSQEEKSIELYQDMLKNAADQKDKALFEFLLKQEKEHLILFEELVAMLIRPEEWVEAAEFGVREEY